jgi:protein tyrosine phosphatase (PTP) superfamily phosphohydrolase (DUF442 family)/cytochrome c556
MKQAALASVLAVALSCSTPQHDPRPLGLSHLENVHEISPGVLTGSGPHGEKSFEELAARGVRTVISVDGAKPEVEAARKYGLRYVHLPIGYDGVPEEKTLAIAKALNELPGPVYVHCHHGKHRGPAAAAVACVAAGKLDNEGAVRVMKTMGTGENYIGLWASAREAKRMDTAAAQVAFKEVAPVPPIMEAMVALEHAFEGLTFSKKAGWTKPADHPDIDPPHEALRAREIVTEILRTDEHKARPADYQGWMKASLDAATELETLLRAKAPFASLDATYAKLQKSCADCHKPYRNTPKK